MVVFLGSTSATYAYLAKDLTKSLSAEAKDAQVARETKYYQDNIGKVKSVDDFMKDTRLFNYAMKAYGLEDMAYAKGFMKKVLNEGVTDKSAFANKLTDTRFKAFATAFNFETLGEYTTTTQAATTGVVDKYVRQTLEDSVGEQDEGTQLALYFQRMAPTVTSAYGLLGDTALWTVVKTVYGFPSEMSSADIDKQKKAVDAKLNVADLQDPAKVDKLLKRFAAVWDATSSSAAYSPILELFSSSSATSTDVTMSILSLKTGG